MKITLYSPKGIEFTKTVSSIQVTDIITGSFGILENHVPIVSTIVSGDIDLIENDKHVYLALTGAVFKFKDNDASVVTEDYAFGDSTENAKHNLELSIENRKSENKARNVELALAENELKKQIKKTGAGKI